MQDNENAEIEFQLLSKNKSNIYRNKSKKHNTTYTLSDMQAKERYELRENSEWKTQIFFNLSCKKKVRKRKIVSVIITNHSQ